MILIMTHTHTHISKLGMMVLNGTNYLIYYNNQYVCGYIQPKYMAKFAPMIFNSINK